MALDNLDHTEKAVDIPSAAVVEKVFLEGFRNYSTLDLTLSPGFNVIAGPNAQGKTNLLEALYLVGTTRILRGHREVEAIQDGALKANVAVELLGSRTRLAISLERGARKRALLNGLAMTRAADLLGRLPIVCVSSVDMAIVRGEPADRRMFADLELSALYPSYLRHFSLYKRALEQRGALIRESRDNALPGAMWEPWEAQLAHHGAAIRAMRQEWVQSLDPEAASVHAQMGSGEHIGISYLRKDDAVTEEEILSLLASNRGTDTARGSTTTGPHRDDISVLIDGREARLYGSQGQQRTAVIAVKMATLQVATQILGQTPLLLLDDILSDLDESRRSLLIDVVCERAGQAVLTCTEASAAGRRILEQAHLFQVEAGRVWQA